MRVRETIEEAFAAVDTASHEYLANLTHTSVATAASELPLRRAIHAAGQSAACVRDNGAAIDDKVASALAYGLDAAEREVLELAKYLLRRGDGGRISRLMQELASVISTLRRTIHGHTHGEEGVD